jgi:branched-chain amino acid transport system ATP-binding protein
MSGSFASILAGSMMLEIRGVSAGYGSFKVLHEIDLTVEEGEVVALFGHNGAGKSTLLKTIYGELRESAGEIILAGSLQKQRSGASSARLGVRYVPQEGNVFPNMSIEDNLRLGAYSVDPDSGLLADRMSEVFDLFPILHERRSVLARSLSGGERQMLAISLALMTAPRLLLLDEPSSGLAPVMVQRVFDTISRLQTDLGATVLLVEQNVNEALRLAGRAYVMQEGHIVLSAPVSEREAIIHHLWGIAAVRQTH